MSGNGGPDRKSTDAAPDDGRTRRAGGQDSASATPQDAPDEAGRDALHQADYGGVPPGAPEEPAPVATESTEGGLSEESFDGTGREPTVARDRDYDPDGDRTGR